MNLIIKLKTLLVVLALVLVSSANWVLASPLSEAAASMAPGESMRFETTGFNNDLIRACGRSTFITDWARDANWNSLTKEVHFVGQGHIACQKQIKYSESNNTWSEVGRKSVDEVDIGHGYEHNTIDPDTGTMYYAKYLVVGNVGAGSNSPLRYRMIHPLGIRLVICSGYARISYPLKRQPTHATSSPIGSPAGAVSFLLLLHSVVGAGAGTGATGKLTPTFFLSRCLKLALEKIRNHVPKCILVCIRPHIIALKILAISAEFVTIDVGFDLWIPDFGRSFFRL